MHSAWIADPPLDHETARLFGELSLPLRDAAELARALSAEASRAAPPLEPLHHPEPPQSQSA
jgi:hypothetical protein